MKLKTRKKKFGKHRSHRNAAPASPAPRRRLRVPRRGAAPDWQTTLAAIAGGAGGAALGGLAVNQQILSPEAVGLGMIGLGGATAYFADGNTRVMGNSVAAAGAGQLALALMARKAIPTERPATGRTSLPGLPPQLSAGLGSAPVPPPRKSPIGGGVVVDMFQDASRELEALDDEPPRDTSRSEIDVIDLDLDDAD